jgi:hypothetical protein
MKCHTLAPASAVAGPLILASGNPPGRKADEKGPAVVHWTARRADPYERPFTKFAHTTHFSLLGQLESCSSCHLLAADAPQRISQSELIVKASGDFVPMQKARCLNCHVRKAAGDNCILCHNYHVGSFPMITLAATVSSGPLATAQGSKP